MPKQPPANGEQATASDWLREGFLSAALSAAPILLVLILLEDHGPAQGRGAETGSMALLAPVVGMVYLFIIVALASAVGLLGAVAAWLSMTSGHKVLGYAFAFCGGMFSYLWFDRSGTLAIVQSLLGLSVPTAIATWRAGRG